MQRSATDPQSDVKEAARLAQLVLGIDEHDADTLACVGLAKAYVSGDFDAAIDMVNETVALNPNSATAWGFRGVTCVYIGQAQEAVGALNAAYGSIRSIPCFS